MKIKLIKRIHSCFAAMCSEDRVAEKDFSRHF
jgi:hypothetical protein